MTDRKSLDDWMERARSLVDEMKPLVAAERAEQGLSAGPSEATKRRIARHFTTAGEEPNDVRRVG